MRRLRLGLLVCFYRLSTPLTHLYLRLFQPQYFHFLRINALADKVYKGGDLAKATAFSLEALQLAENYLDDWNYGNVIHDSRQMLGLVALQMGDVDQAKTQLLAAGRTPGSPQLDSFGPHMLLARELLEQGERQVVTEYLDLVAKFWVAEKDARFREIEQDHKQLLQEWKADIGAGRIPEYYLWQESA